MKDVSVAKEIRQPGVEPIPVSNLDNSHPQHIIAVLCTGGLQRHSNHWA